MTETVTTHGKDLSQEELKQVLHTGIPAFDNGEALAVAEFFGENRIGKWQVLKNHVVDHIHNLVSLRVFNGNNQLKLRRLGDDAFRAVSDLHFDGWAEITSGLTYNSNTQIALWGYVSDKLNNVLYEEQIPMVLEYPEPINALHPLSTGEKEKKNRFAVAVSLFSSKDGTILWDRFESIVPWKADQNPAFGGKKNILRSPIDDIAHLQVKDRHGST